MSRLLMPLRRYEKVIYSIMRLSGREGRAPKDVHKRPERAGRSDWFCFHCGVGAGLSWGFLCRRARARLFCTSCWQWRWETWGLWFATWDVGRGWGVGGQGVWGLKAVSSQKWTSFLERPVYHSFSFVIHLLLCVLSKNYFPNSNM